MSEKPSRPSEGVVRIWAAGDPSANPREIRENMHSAWGQIQPLVAVPLSQHQVDALTSLMLGLRGSDHSLQEVAVNILRPVNKGHFYVAAQSFSQFCLRKGRMSRTMERLRKIEAETFLNH